MTDPAQLQSLIDSNPKIKEALATLQTEVGRAIENKEQAALLLADILGANPVRPKGWDMNSSASYYKEVYGLKVKEWLIQLEQIRPKSLLINASKLRISRRSLKMLVWYGLRWLIERGPEEDRKKFENLKAQTEIRVVALGVLLRWKLHTLDADVEPVEPKPSGSKKWKQEFDTFITSKREDNDRLKIENLCLETYDMEYVRDVIKSAPGFFGLKITMGRIEVIYNKTIWDRMEKK